MSDQSEDQEQAEPEGGTEIQTDTSTTVQVNEPGAKPVPDNPAEEDEGEG